MANRVSKRAVLVGPNRPIEIWERPILPPQAGEVLLRVSMAGVCGTDVHFWRGEVPLPGPVVLGKEGTQKPPLQRGPRVARGDLPALRSSSRHSPAVLQTLISSQDFLQVMMLHPTVRVSLTAGI
jgi:hypothetical protein